MDGGYFALGLPGNELSAIIFTGLVALGVGVASFFGTLLAAMLSRSNEIKRATLDLLLQNERDGELLESQRIFNELVKKNEVLEYAESKNHATPESEEIRRFLNQYELIAIGIRNGSLSKEIYRQWFASGIIKHWEHAGPYVQRLRVVTGNKRIFIEFEWLKEELEQDAPKKPNWIVRVWKKFF